MRAHRRDLQTPDDREFALTKLANAAFHGRESMIVTLLDKPSRTSGTGSLTVREFARAGISEFRSVEKQFLHSSIANIPLKAFLEDFERFMPEADLEFVKFMIRDCHGEKYDRILNQNKLETVEERLQTLSDLYEAHGAEGIDEPSENFTFDDETREEEFANLEVSPGRHIKIPIMAAHASYVGLMNAICDLFLDPAKQKAEDMAAWYAHKYPDGPSPWDVAAE